ncbi:hypothetical protein Hanom_Chr04g00359741 [Helianthus anomalus]
MKRTRVVEIDSCQIQCLDSVVSEQGWPAGGMADLISLIRLYNISSFFPVSLTTKKKHTARNETYMFIFLPSDPSSLMFHE